MFYCSAKLINLYRNEHRIDANAGYNDPAVATGISDLLDGGRGSRGNEENASSAWGNNQPGVERVRTASSAVSLLLFWNSFSLHLESHSAI